MRSLISFLALIALAVPPLVASETEAVVPASTATPAASAPSVEAPPAETVPAPAASTGEEGSRPPGFWPHLVEFTGHFHPIAIHFPIALILAAVLAEFLVMCGAARFGEAARFCLRLGAPAGIVAAALGWAAGANFPAGDILSLHRWFGTVAAFVAVAALVAQELDLHYPTSGRHWTYRVLLLVTAALIGAAGHFGGILTHGPNNLAW